MHRDKKTCRYDKRWIKIRVGSNSLTLYAPTQPASQIYNHPLHSKQTTRISVTKIILPLTAVGAQNNDFIGLLDAKAQSIYQKNPAILGLFLNMFGLEPKESHIVDLPNDSPDSLQKILSESAVETPRNPSGQVKKLSLSSPAEKKKPAIKSVVSAAASILLPGKIPLSVVESQSPQVVTPSRSRVAVESPPSAVRTLTHNNYDDISRTVAKLLKAKEEKDTALALSVQGLESTNEQLRSEIRVLPKKVEGVSELSNLSSQLSGTIDHVQRLGHRMDALEDKYDGLSASVGGLHSKGDISTLLTRYSHELNELEDRLDDLPIAALELDSHSGSVETCQRIEVIKPASGLESPN